MKCGLYDESYKIAADTNFLVNYLYNCHLKVAYLPEFVTRMRMGGMSTDSAKRKKVTGTLSDVSFRRKSSVFNFFHHKKTLKMLAETKNISTFALSKNK